MTCTRCQGCMAQDHFLDLQESGGEWWMECWRCINCGYVFDPVVEKNRQLQEAKMVSSPVTAQQASEPGTINEQESSLDIAA